jgi:hypothetical protein
LLLGHRRAAQLLAFLALLPATAAAISVTTDLPALAPLVLPAWANLLLSGLLVLALAAFHHDAPPVPRRPWLLALGVAIAVLMGLSPLVRPTTPWVLLDWPGLYCLALVGAALAHLAGPALGRTDRAPSWSLALALLAPAVFGLRVLSLLHYLGITPSGQRYALLVVGALEALAVLAVGGRWPGSPPTCCAASRRYRPPPPRRPHRPGNHQLSHASRLRCGIRPPHDGAMVQRLFRATANRR